MEQVLNKNNIAIQKKILSTDKKMVINKKSVLNRTIKKICIQIIVCSILITTIYLYKIYNYSSFEYVNNKYNWLIKYNMTYINTYNNIAGFLNKKFQFKIPLKVEMKEIEENEYTINVDEKKDINASLTESSDLQSIADMQDEAVLVSTGYDNMRIMADEIKTKYNWTIPTNGKITSPFGVRDPSSPDISSFHMGIDIANVEGTEIYSAIDGEVIEATYNNVYGNYIKIARDDVITIYAHCSKLIVKQGENVTKGDKIALVGSTGISTGPHLHFEIRKNSEVINPEYILNFR
ncbi:MAG: M23 family metallopeptidase [Clostridiales bacterium]|nr:M23 family metallopeptidase [Clostridiales bacterium]